MDFPKGVKAEKLRTLIFDFADKSLTFLPTPASIEMDIQRGMKAIYGIDTISRYLCDWYAREISKKGNDKPNLRKKVQMVINTLETGLKLLKNILQRDI